MAILQMLFSKTVGPLKDNFMVYNSQGKSKGMAIVTFARPGDAALARSKYHGKIVDGSECHLSLARGALYSTSREMRGSSRSSCGAQCEYWVC